MRLDFKIDERLFQRGQMWRECVEEWLSHRNTFLQSVQEPPLLEKTLKVLNKHSTRRFAMIYSINSLDSVLSLPFVGATFHTSRHVTRFFSFEYFFPVFNDQLGRGYPRLLSLDRNGSVKYVWGPRPESVTEHIAKQVARGKSCDHALTEYARDAYPSELDDSLSAAIQSIL